MTVDDAMKLARSRLAPAATHPSEPCDYDACSESFGHDDCGAMHFWNEDRDAMAALVAEVERLRELVANGDLKEVYAEGLTLGQKLAGKKLERADALRAELLKRSRAASLLRSVKSQGHSEAYKFAAEELAIVLRGES